jgi:hypothetical protein
MLPVTGFLLDLFEFMQLITGAISNSTMIFYSLILALVVVAFTGCRTIRPLPAVDINQPGWTAQQGQAVWKSKASAPEIAGELVLATRPDGSSFLQFTKTPLPFVVAQTTSNSWQIQFVPENRTFSAHGKPPARLLWLQLPRCLLGRCDEKRFEFSTLKGGNRLLRDRKTGESIEFYLTGP